MRSLLANGMPVASSCKGDGVCSRCHIQVIEGSKNLSPTSDLEVELIEKNNLPVENRLSCQVSVLGDITIDTTYW